MCNSDGAYFEPQEVETWLRSTSWCLLALFHGIDGTQMPYFSAVQTNWSAQLLMTHTFLASIFGPNPAAVITVEWKHFGFHKALFTIIWPFALVGFARRLPFRPPKTYCTNFVWFSHFWPSWFWQCRVHICRGVWVQKTLKEDVVIATRPDFLREFSTQHYKFCYAW